MRTIPLTKGYKALVDDIDYEELSRYEWYAHVTDRIINLVFAARTYNTNYISMSVVVAYKHGTFVDGHDIEHIDGNLLNCQSSNLRASKAPQKRASPMSISSKLTK